jgi:hypothetical protein
MREGIPRIPRIKALLIEFDQQYKYTASIAISGKCVKQCVSQRINSQPLTARYRISLRSSHKHVNSLTLGIYVIPNVRKSVYGWH